MEHRIFGKEITNIPNPDAQKSRRGYSTLHEDRLSLHSQVARAATRSTSVHVPAVPVPEGNPQMVPDYFHDNMQFLKTQEKSGRRLHNYVSGHRVVTEANRAKLIDWLGELHQKYRMFPET